MPSITLISYSYDLYFDNDTPRELQEMVENLLTAIPGVENANVHHDWAELRIDADVVREQDSEEKYFAQLEKLCLEVAETVNTARLLLTKIEGEAT